MFNLHKTEIYHLDVRVFSFNLHVYKSSNYMVSMNLDPNRIWIRIEFGQIDRVWWSIDFTYIFIDNDSNLDQIEITVFNATLHSISRRFVSTDPLKAFKIYSNAVTVFIE